MFEIFYNACSSTGVGGRSSDCARAQMVTVDGNVVRLVVDLLESHHAVVSIQCMNVCCWLPVYSIRYQQPTDPSRGALCPFCRRILVAPILHKRVPVSFTADIF